ncbi:MAG TPA: tripartite tricarboxylate transporter substrate binding protein [Paenibacillaceae bacterium]
MKPYRVLLVMLVCLVLFIAGCGGQKGSQSGGSSPSASPSPSPSPSSGASTGQSQQPSASPQIDFPKGTIRIIAPFAPGGSIDTVSRAFAEAVVKHLPNNPTIVVDNKTGGGGVIGTTEMVNSAPDGHTLAVLPNGPTVIAPHMGTTTYQLEDMVPVARLTSIPQALLVREDAPWKTFEEWFEYVKANPDKFTVGTSGPGTTAHLALEAVNYVAGIKMRHVPFDGSSTATTNALGGHVDGAILEGRKVEGLRAIFTTGKSDAYPDAAVLEEKGINVKSEVFNGVFAPKGTPREIVELLYEAFRKAAEDPKVIETLDKAGIKINVLGPDEFKALLEEESNINKTIIESAGLKQ